MKNLRRFLDIFKVFERSQYNPFSFILRERRSFHKMAFILRKSAVDPALFEIVEDDAVVQEIPIGFRIFKIPRSFPSVQAVLRWVGEEEKRLVKQSAYRLMAIKNQSSEELRRKLVRRGFSQGATLAVIEESTRLGLIADKELEIALIEKELRSGHGPRYIEMKLRSLGLDSSSAQRVVTEERQREAIRKWIPKLKNPAASLQRRGFTSEIIFSELKNFLRRG
jgi:SOS response regulatory protein OraA/RecX